MLTHMQYDLHYFSSFSAEKKPFANDASLFTYQSSINPTYLYLKAIYFSYVLTGLESPFEC